jgi:hypothetical protein
VVRAFGVKLVCGIGTMRS